MRFIILAFFVISALFGFLNEYGVIITVGGGESLNVQTSIAEGRSLSSAQADLTSRAGEFAGSGGISGDIKSVGGLVQSTYSVFVSMMMFRFEIVGAPIEVNAFFAMVFGIMGLFIWFDLLGRIISMLPFFGSS